MSGPADGHVGSSMSTLPEPPKVPAWYKGEYRIFPHDGTAAVLGTDGKMARTLVYTENGLLLHLTNRRCDWCGSKYNYMTTRPNNVQRYCPACLPKHKQVLQESINNHLTVYMREKWRRKDARLRADPVKWAKAQKTRRQWYENNREYCRQKSRQWYDNNKEYAKRHHKSHYENNRAEINHRNRECYQKHREARKAASLEYRKSHIKETKAQQKAWYESVGREHIRRKRAAIKPYIEPKSNMEIMAP